MNKGKLACIFLIVSFVFSCQTEQKDIVNQSQRANKLFNLNDFMNSEIEYLEKNNKGITKIISINGKEEKQVFDDVNWNEELAVIGDMNIDKVAWVDEFTTDTIAIDEKRMQVIYKSDDIQIPISKMILHVEDGTVKTIEIKKQRKSFFFNSDHNIKYESRMGYTLRGNQKALFISNHEMNISAYYK